MVGKGPEPSRVGGLFPPTPQGRARLRLDPQALAREREGTRCGMTPVAEGPNAVQTAARSSWATSGKWLNPSKPGSLLNGHHNARGTPRPSSKFSGNLSGMPGYTQASKACLRTGEGGRLALTAHLNLRGALFPPPSPRSLLSSPNQTQPPAGSHSMPASTPHLRSALHTGRDQSWFTPTTDFDHKGQGRTVQRKYL